MPVTTSSAEALQAFQAGEELFDNVQYHDAERQFERAVKLDPQFALAYLYLALSNPSAKGFYDNIHAASQNSSRVSEGERLLIEATLAGGNGEPTKQTELLLKLAALYPRDERTQFFLAAQYFGQQQYDSAVSVCERIVKLTPNYPPPYNILGYSYRFLNKGDAAGKAFQEYIRLTPDDPNPYDSYAELLMHQGHFEEAIVQYRNALQRDRTFGASRLGIASNLMYLGRYDESRNELQILYDSAVNSAQRRAAILGTAVSFIDEGQFDQGLQRLDDLYRFEIALPDTATAIGDLVTMIPVLTSLERFQDAEARLTELLSLVDKSDLFARLKKNAHQDAYIWRANILVKQGKTAEARGQVEAYLREVDPEIDAGRIRNAYLVMGLISISEKDYDRAIAELEQANLNLALANYYLAQAYEGKGNRSEAAGLYAEAAEAYQINSITYALIRKDAGRKAEALNATPAP
jgi:tetratricopeptide (TPR) repeat protein